MSSELQGKVLVLGAGGFVGRHLAEALRLAGVDEIVGVDRPGVESHGDRSLSCDLVDRGAVRELLVSERPDYVVNLAAIFRAETMERLLSLNLGLPTEICETAVACEEWNPKRILLLGSAAEFGYPETLPVCESTPFKPVAPYGISKVLQSQLFKYYFRARGLPLNLARPFNIAGRGLSEMLSLGSFAKQIGSLRSGGVMKVGNLSSRRDYLAAEDVAAALVAILSHAPVGEDYNVCLGESFLMQDLVDAMIGGSGKSIALEVEAARLKTADVDDIYGTSAKLQADTGWEPTYDVLKCVASMA